MTKNKMQWKTLSKAAFGLGSIIIALDIIWYGYSFPDRSQLLIFLIVAFGMYGAAYAHSLFEAAVGHLHKHDLQFDVHEETQQILHERLKDIEDKLRREE